MMAVSYKKLWHILLDRDMKKRDLQEAAGLTKDAMNKLSRDQNVSTEVDRKSTRLNSSHIQKSRMPSSA